MRRPCHADPVRNRLRGGFTLIEILVAMVIASLLLVVLFSIIGETMTISRRTIQSLLAANSAATAMDTLAVDLAGLMSLEGDAEYLVVEEETVGGLTNACMRFLTASPNNVTAGTGGSPRSGQPGFVAYRLARYDSESLEVGDPPSHPAYGLFRSTTGGSNTFAEMGGSSISKRSTPPAMEEFFANNVVEFRVQPIKNGAPVPGALNSLRLTSDSPAGNARPDALRVMLCTLDADGARRLSEGGSTFEEIKKKHGRVLVRLIPLADGSVP